MTELAIRTMGLSRRFGDVQALDGVDLEIPRGTIFGLLGPNGSGKTTTIRLLLGLLEPTSGRAEVLGRDTRADGAAIREETGALLEHCGLYERLSAEENLELYARIWRLPRADRRARVAELLERMGLWARRGEAVAGWSRGMKQQLAIARALLHRPRLVFLDEPTAGLDPVAAPAVRETLAALVAADGITVLLTTHNLAEAERLCHLVGVLRHGRLLAVAPPGQLAASRDVPTVEVEGSGFSESMRSLLLARDEVRALRVDGRRLTIDLRSAEDVSAVLTCLVAAGFQLEQARTASTSLEQAFAALVEGA